MAEESVPLAVEADPTREPAPVGGHEESGARGMLREAILKVMEEIEQHEREAKLHLQKATELRKALRESISFLHEEGEKKTPMAIQRAARSDKTGGASPEDKVKQGVSSSKNQRVKKK
jgi:hypothetical protein